MSLAKQVVRCAVRVTLLKATGLGSSGDSVVVEWKRGKHHGTSGAAAAKGGGAVWEGAAGEIVIPCTLYFLPKKRAFEEKSLSVALVRGRQLLARAAVALDVLAQELGETGEATATRREEGEGGVVLEYLVHMRRLHDPRDKAASSAASSPMPVRPRPVAASLGGDDSPTTTLSESPLQSIDARATPSPAASAPFVAPAATPEPRRSPGTPAVPSFASIPTSPKVEKEFGYASSGGIPMSARSQHERTGSSNSSTLPSVAPVPMPISVGSTDARGSRTPSMQRETSQLQRSSDLEVGSAVGLGPGGASGKTSKKTILGGAGHRRGKSHAVTPDELRGLHAGPDLRQSPQLSQAAMSSGAMSGQNSRKSNAAKLGSKLGFKRPDRGSNSVSQAFSPLSPRGPEDVRRAAAADFLIAGNLSSSSSSDFEEEPLALPLALPPSRASGAVSSPTLQRASSSGASPNLSAGGGGGAGSSEHREEIQFYQRQLADQGRRRDQSYVLQHFVAFCQPVYTREMSVSAWVLFRCLAEWDAFGSDGREFREQLLEGFEQLSKNAMNQQHQLYWLSTLLSLLSLLRSKLRPIPRSDVPRNNGLSVFQERLRGLAAAMCSRAAALAVAELRPLVSQALLEHAVLEDSAGPSAPKQKQPVGTTQPRATVASIVAVLDALRVSLEAAHVLASVAAQLMARVAHALAAMALNALLDNNPRLCTFSNGLQMRKPVLELRGWLTRHRFDAAAALLVPLEEVVNVLCMNKSALVEAEVRREVCPTLSSAQLGQLLLLYTPDAFDSEPIHPAILAALCGDNVADFKMDVELRRPLSLDLAEASYELAECDLPKSVTEQPSLAFLSRSFADDTSASDAW